MKIILFPAAALIALALQLAPALASADCGGYCDAGPTTPSYAVQACQSVNGYPLDIRQETCENSNCLWRQGQEVDVCAAGPGTPSYAVQSCQMVNSYPQDIREETCVNTNGCVMTQECE